ncbi:AAA family ATPase [Paenibacillus agricola]|uniref:AAA family ATPase n=1 Tax=Paenibacillus agricola TaxID=2716264 RepID=A0ABX0J768_9BACL|nr:AAA family ATPase [Paenibacillus agricola]NHN30717.1 AAA family ATPase [Paenibacillus agricola]
MVKMKLVLLEEDHYFVDMCASYIRTSEHAETFMLAVFTNKEQGFAYVEQTKEPYILLVHEGFLPLPEQVFQQRSGCLIILSDTFTAADIVEYPVLCKYQPLNQLLSHMISHFNEYTSSSKLKGNRSAAVISVYSAVGGSGKTLTAVHLARELFHQGARVFYLNLEQLPSRSWIEGGSKPEETYFSRILYYGKADVQLQTAKVELYKRRHPLMGFDYFPGMVEPAEMEEMTAKDTESLIRSILATGVYDKVVIDLDSTVQPRTLAALRLSDQVMWLVVDDRVHLEKTDALMKQLKLRATQENEEWLRKITILVNKFNGVLLNNRDAFPAAISGFLPYVPEWKAYGSIEALQARGAFSESLSKLGELGLKKAEAQVYVAR